MDWAGLRTSVSQLSNVHAVAVSCKIIAMMFWDLRAFGQSLARLHQPMDHAANGARIHVHVRQASRIRRVSHGKVVPDHLFRNGAVKL